jgi:hypothetical protein
MKACALMLVYHMPDQASMSNDDFRCSEDYKSWFLDGSIGVEFMGKLLES